MRPLIVFRHVPNINFMALHKLGFVLSIVLTVASIGLFLTRGLNYGIDFSGGTVIEARTQGPADLAAMRSTLDGLGIGNVSLQSFGSPDNVLIRLQQQAGADRKAQEEAVTKVKQSLGKGVEFRRTDVVGPKVGSELVRAGTIATVLALLAIAVYVWFRFEWQFGVGAMLSTLHDTITTIGIFSLFQIEFNLTTLAAILTIAGYSINDTVVIYDRVRETLRKHKTMDFSTLINKSLNETLSRTILTVSTVALMVLSLLFFGGEVLRGFSIAMLWGVVIGTYSSLFIAAPLLNYIRPATARGKETSRPPDAAAPAGSGRAS
jgi:preprotein translocase SecF subunit